MHCSGACSSNYSPERRRSRITEEIDFTLYYAQLRKQLTRRLSGDAQIGRIFHQCDRDLLE